MKKRLLTNISSNFIIQIVSYVISFLEVMYVTRVLQPGIYGKVSLAASIAGYFVMLANLGRPIYAVRICAGVRENRAKLGMAFNEFWSLGVVLSAFSALAFAVTVLAVPSLRTDINIYIIYVVSVLLQLFVCDWLYKGVEKFRFLAIVTLICKAVSLAGILMFVQSSDDVILYVVLSMLVLYGSNLICFALRGKLVDSPLRFIINRNHFKPFFVFFMMSCAVTIYSNLDITMLGLMKSDYETGLYSLAAKGKQVLAMTGGLVWSACLPVATELWEKEEKSRFEELALKSLSLVSAFQTIVAVVCFIFADWIIPFVGGEAYIDAVPAFRILLVSLIPIAASNILGGQVLIPAGKEKNLLYSEIAGAAFNFGANLFLIPRYGIEGAALTTLLSEIIVWLMCVYFCKKELDINFGIKAYMKACKMFIGKCRRIYIEHNNRREGREDKFPFFCPCCDNYFSSFIDRKFAKQPKVFNPARYNAIDQKLICPVCGSLPRHRILVSWMNENSELFKGRKILYFAEEYAIRLWCNRNDIKVTTADLFTAADLKLDIEDTGLEPASYDIIVCNHVLEHVSDYKKALNELHRIVSPDGMVIISFPIDTKLPSVYEDSTITTREECVKHFGQCDHRRIFGADSRSMLENAGFTVTDISGDADFCDRRIKPIVGPADYDYNVLWCLKATAKTL